MAHKKAAGSAKNLRDSKPKYRWVKLFWGQTTVAGNIIIRQKGQKFVAWDNTYTGRDSTIHASIDGVVSFSRSNITRFDWRKYLKTVVYVVPHGEEKKAVVAKATKDLAPKSDKTPVTKGSPRSTETAVVKKAPAKKTTAKTTTKKTVAKKAPAKKTTKK